MSGYPWKQRRGWEERFWARVQKTEGCWLWTGPLNRLGYGKYIESTAHRYSWRIAHGAPPPPGMHVCHHCDNRRCVRPDHLFLGTGADNLADKMAKGRQARGERVNTARLAEAQVLEIRRRRLAGEYLVPLAREFGVSHQTIRRIELGETWKHLWVAP